MVQAVPRDTGPVSHPSVPTPERLPVGVERRRAGERFVTEANGARTQHSFSFGTHYDPDNVGFGPLVVHNDDLIQPGGGYGVHPHRDAEIVTWVLSGALTHEDSTGDEAVVVPGMVQRLSAGSGIVHSERNDAQPAGAPLHLIQMWLTPDHPGAGPSYQVRRLDLTALARDWVAIASGGHPDAVVTLDCRSATLWATRLASNASRQLPCGERVHAFLARGAVDVSTVGALRTGDALRIHGRQPLWITGTEDAEVLVWQIEG